MGRWLGAGGWELGAVQAGMGSVGRRAVQGRKPGGRGGEGNASMLLGYKPQKGD